MAKNTGNKNRINFNNIRKVRDIIKLVRKYGWVFDRQVGSHKHFIHAIKPGLVTVTGHLGQDLPRGTRNSILKQAGLKG